MLTSSIQACLLPSLATLTFAYSAPQLHSIQRFLSACAPTVTCIHLTRADISRESSSDALFSLTSVAEIHLGRCTVSPVFFNRLANGTLWLRLRTFVPRSFIMDDVAADAAVRFVCARGPLARAPSVTAATLAGEVAPAGEPLQDLRMYDLAMLKHWQALEMAELTGLTFEEVAGVTH